MLEFEAFRNAQTIHTYIGALTGEVDTRPVVASSLAGGKRVVCPRVEWYPPPMGRGAWLPSMSHQAIGSLNDLERSERGLWEPRDGPAVPPEDLDLIVVPGVAFDRAGNRLGLGGGFYDRFLSSVDAPTMALAFSLQLVPQVPTTAQDVPIDWILTEQETIDCRKGRDANAGEATR